MNRAAASSSSLVVTPGRTLEASILRQRAWTAPAAAIRSICSGVFLTITPAGPALELLLHAERGEDGADAIAHLVRAERAVHPAEQPPLVVVGDQRLGLGVILLEPVADHLRLVVVADDQARAADVANAVVLRRVELDVEHVSLLDAGPPPPEPAHHLLVGHVYEQRRSELAAHVGQLAVQRFGLHGRAREAVEDEPVRGLLARDPL